MQLLIVGLNHKTAPVSIREQLTFSSSQLCDFLDRRAAARRHKVTPTMASVDSNSDSLRETVLLSTCNRLEFYAIARDPNAKAEMIRLLSEAVNLPPDDFEDYLYSYENEAAVAHLMKVAAGLDSLVLGEAQILGQVIRAYQSAVTHHATGRILPRLFETAIHAGKRARTETGIGVNPASVSSVAVQLAKQHLGNLDGRTVMVLGAGEMADLTLQALNKNGVSDVIVVNRSIDRGDLLADKWGAKAIVFDQLKDYLPQADVIVASTGAPHPVLFSEQLAPAMESRLTDPLLILDIALPRDVDDEVALIPNIILYNLDHLQLKIDQAIKSREAEIPHVEAILQAEIERFNEWRNSLDVVPTIVHFRSHFETIRQQELAWAYRRLGDTDEKTLQVVEQLTERLMKKYLHQPMVTLKSEAAQGNGIQHVQTLRELFSLES